MLPRDNTEGNVETRLGGPERLPGRGGSWDRSQYKCEMISEVVSLTQRILGTSSASSP